MVWIPQTHWTRQTGTPKKKKANGLIQNTTKRKVYAAGRQSELRHQDLWWISIHQSEEMSQAKKTQWNLKPRSYKLPFMWCCISHHFFISLLGLYHINKVLIYYYIFTASKCPVLAMCLKCAVILVFKFTHMHKDKEQPIARKSLEADALKRVKSKYGGAEGGFKRLQCTSRFFFVFFKYFVFNETFYTPC